MIPDSLFPPPQSPCFVLFRVLVSPFSESRFFFLRVHSPSSPSSSFISKSSPILLRVPLPSSPIPVPVLSRPLSSSRSPLPSSPSSPLLLRAKENSGTTRSRPAVLGCGVVSSKMEHDSFISRSSTVCSRSACKLQSGCSCSPTASRYGRKCIDSLQCQASSNCTSSSRQMKIPCLPLFFI